MIYSIYSIEIYHFSISKIATLDLNTDSNHLQEIMCSTPLYYVNKLIELV